MTDEIVMLEDGEIEEEDDSIPNIYETIDRPKIEKRVFEKLINSDESDNDNDSDDGIVKIKAKAPDRPKKVDPQAQSKSGNLWKAMLQEESLMEDLKTCDVSTSRKRKYERGAESYDFESFRNCPDDLNYHVEKKKRIEVSDNESSNSSNKSKDKKRKIKKAKRKNNRHANQSPKLLPDISASLDCSDEEFGKEIALHLEEENVDLIVRAVTVIGRDESLNIFKSTQNIERKGGMLTLNKMRRRTPGGIFLFLLKTSNRIDEKQKKDIFDPDDKSVHSDQHESNETDPPPSPEKGEFVITKRTDTDPDIVSQKILNISNANNKANLSNGNEEVLEINYNSDMDTF